MHCLAVIVDDGKLEEDDIHVGNHAPLVALGKELGLGSTVGVGGGEASGCHVGGVKNLCMASRVGAGCGLAWVAIYKPDVMVILGQYPPLLWGSAVTAAGLAG